MNISFYDHDRQSYGALPLHNGAAAEFMIGDYGRDKQNEDGGEFTVVLKRLQNGRGGYELVAQLQVFGDGTGSLLVAIDAGLLDAMKEPVRDRDEFSERLIAIGIRDRSDHPIGSPDPVCHCCGQAVVRERAVASRDSLAPTEETP